MVIVDSHVHVWNAHPLEELLAQMRKSGVEKLIAVGAVNADNPDNNEEIARCVSENPGKVAAMAGLNIQEDDALSQVQHASDELGLQGFSSYLSPDDSLDWFADDIRQQIWTHAEERNLSVSLSIFPKQHAALRAIAQQHPGIRFMLCHIGRPDRNEGPPYSDFQEVLRSSECPNIYVKISGFYAYTEKPWDFPYLDVHKWVRMVLAAYGPERMCWGSDFSPVLNHSTYRQSLEAIRTHAPYLSPSDLEWVLGKAAMNAVGGLE